MKSLEGISRKQRIIFIMLVLLNIVTGCAMSMNAPRASEADKTYQAILSVEGQEKNSLFVNANSWFVDTFNTAGSVIQYQDKEAGKIMGKFVYVHKDSMYWYSIKSTVSVEIKDNKVRLSFYDPSFAVVGDNLNGNYHDNREYQPITEPIMIVAKENWLNLEASLRTALTRTSTW